VCGTWYPGSQPQLAQAIDAHLAAAQPGDVPECPRAVIAPHAGLMYSGPVAAYAYSLVQRRTYDAVVLVGPSHFVPFRGVSLWPRGSWRTPFGDVPVAADLAAAIAAESRDIVELADAHGREHSLEMQLPFIARLLPGVPIVPLVMGYQRRETANALGDALARALARRPDLLLMDEPFAAVEEDLRAHLRAELVRVQGETQIPVLLVTHSLTEAYSLAQRLVVLYRGEVMQHGARDEVYRRPSTPEVARLMGMSNILSVNVAGQDRGQLSVDWNGVRLAIAHDGVQPSGPSLVLGVRPEEISFVGPNVTGDLPNRLTGFVEREKEFGADHLLEVQVNSGRLEVRVTHPFYVATALGVGQSRALTIDPNRFHIFPKRG